jgi:hypothetical protein
MPATCHSLLQIWPSTFALATIKLVQWLEELIDSLEQSEAEKLGID